DLRATEDRVRRAVADRAVVVDGRGVAALDLVAPRADRPPLELRVPVGERQALDARVEQGLVHRVVVGSGERGAGSGELDGREHARRRRAAEVDDERRHGRGGDGREGPGEAEPAPASGRAGTLALALEALAQG